MYSLDILQRLIRLKELDTLLDESSPVSFDGCMHKERTALLDSTMEWMSLAVGRHDWLHGINATRQGNLPASIADHLRNKTYSGIDLYLTVRRDLWMSSLQCPSCKEQRGWVRKGALFKNMDHGLVVNRPGQMAKDGNDDGEIVEPREVEDVGDASGGEEESMPDPRSELLELARQLQGTVVEGRKEAVRKSKPVQPYRFGEATPLGVVSRFDEWFDSYHTGPSAETVVEMHLELCAWFHADPAVASWSTVAMRFSDHGYRRMPGGFHQFYLNEPDLKEQVEHLFPLPPNEVLEEWKERRATTEMDLNQLVNGEWKGHLPESMIDGKDLEVWPLSKMVEEGGKGTAEERMKIYVTGRTSTGSYIRLDVHKSRERVDNLNFSVDIDSVIWETDKLKAVGPINLQLLPFKGPKAPISKHNHTYVKLYWPRTDQDVVNHRRSAASQEVPISNLPNTHFAHFGRVQGAAEVFVVFPRMKHRHPLRRGSETKLPYEVETFWFRHLVYPALNKLKAAGVKPYTNFVYEDILFKHKGAKEQSIMVSPQHLEEILQNIHGTLKENASRPHFSRFGSLFFVLQIVGMKVSTSLDEGWAELWEKLVRQHSNLDWEYMENPANGELLVDLGFGVHPPEDRKVVGFWDIDALRVGFDYGGYSQGTSHKVSTMPAIGGIHAEMGYSRRKRTHIAYRLTYNLVYEVLRGRRTRLKEGFFPPSSAYNLDPKYKQDVKDVVEAYERNKEKSYGLRDEYRCRGSTVKRALPLLEDKVRGRRSPRQAHRCNSNLTYQRSDSTSTSWTPSSGSPPRTGLPLFRGESKRSANSRSGFITSRTR